MSLKNRILSSLPDGKEISGDKGYKLSDVKAGKVKLQDFTAQLSLDELEAISRGEGPMNSSLGAKGNAGAFGGVLKSLRERESPDNHHRRSVRNKTSFRLFADALRYGDSVFLGRKSHRGIIHGNGQRDDKRAATCCWHRV